MGLLGFDKIVEMTPKVSKIFIYGGSALGLITLWEILPFKLVFGDKTLKQPPKQDLVFDDVEKREARFFPQRKIKARNFQKSSEALDLREERFLAQDKISHSKPPRYVSWYNVPIFSSFKKQISSHVSFRN